MTHKTFSDTGSIFTQINGKPHFETEKIRAV